VILLGIGSSDGEEDIEWLLSKIIHLRVFDDDAGVMNRSILDAGGEIMVVSQFTLMARVKKGNRPSYIDAAPPPVTIPLYDAFVAALRSRVAAPVVTGKFGATMEIELVNDGPVTILIDSKNRV
jgi:D-tyrosyl-tRNA(Tyr) deacylase